MFGVAADVVGVRSSCFMVMYAVVAVTMVWTWAGRANEREDILSEHEDVCATNWSATDLLDPRSAAAGMADRLAAG